jgi:hypothetical protein
MSGKLLGIELIGDIMETKCKRFLVVLAVWAGLFFSAPYSAVARDTFAGDIEALLPIWVWEQHELSVVSVAPLVLGDDMVGVLTVYDDPATERPTDYFELYDNTGVNLLAVGWFDKFGIERTAIDRGVLDGADELQGVFVVVIDGYAV